MNSPTRGAVARSGADTQKFIASLQLPGAFVYEVLRGSTEHYLFVLYQGTLRIYDLNTFTYCTVTGSSAYLNPTPGVLDCDNFRIQSVFDHHFIINKSVIPLMDTGSASANPNPAAIVFFKSANYETTYGVSVEYAGTVYTFTYQTPDNSVPYNFQFVQTNQMAATFYRAMTNSVATGGGQPGTIGSGGLSGSTGTGYSPTDHPSTVVGSVVVGNFSQGSGNVSGPTTLTSLGFTVAIDGNLLLIKRASDQNPFTVDATDGDGNASITVIQDEVQSLADLPRGGFQNYVVKVNGVGGNSANASYYLKYNGAAGQGGAWVECVAKNTYQNFDDSTMPIAVFCSAPDTFAIQTPSWLPRICGDGTTSAFNPGFIGNALTDICYFNGRLALLTAGTYDLTTAGNPYSFWRKTAQTTLDDDPISGQIGASNTTSVIERGAVIDENLTLWAQRAQFRLNSGVQAFTASNIQDPQSTSYEFNGKCNFLQIGTRLYFCYEDEGWATVHVLQFSQGRTIGETDITAHVPSYIPAGVRSLQASAPIKMAFVRTDGAANQLYVYNWLLEGEETKQSAWNVWNLPEGTILWHGIYQQKVYLLLQRTDGCMFLTVPLNPAHVDPGGAYTTRLDLRLSEGGVTSKTYDSGGDQTTIVLPFTLSVAEQSLLRVVCRTSDSNMLRGKIATVVSTSSNSIVVRGDFSTSAFYVGLRIRSVRQESDFYIRTSTGHIPTERLTVRRYVVDFRNTGYSRIEVMIPSTGNSVTEEVGKLGTTMLGADPQLYKGSFSAIVDADALDASIKLINDSPFPSEWTSVTYEFESVERATPMLTPMGGPVQ